MDIRFFDINNIKGFNSVYKKLSPKDFGYDLFDEPPAFAAYAGDKPVGLATLLFVPDETGDFLLEAELTLFVHPDYRHRGIAGTLTGEIKKYTAKHYPKLPVVFTLPENLSDSSFAKHRAYKELLMSAKPAILQRLPSRSEIFKLLSDMGLKIICENFSTLSCRVFKDNEEIAHVFINRDGGTACLYSLFVVPCFREQGIGQAITEYALSFMQKDDIPVILNVRDTNVAALGLYKKIGFVKVEECVFFKLLY